MNFYSNRKIRSEFTENESLTRIRIDKEVSDSFVAKKGLTS